MDRQEHSDPARTETFHDRTVAEVVAALGTDAEGGLSVAEAAARRARFGANVLPRRGGRSALVRLLLQFHHPLVYVLLAATAVTLALGKWTDAAVIFGVVLLNAVIGFVQEARAQRALEALAAMLQTESTLVRGGRKARVCSADVVPGDVVLLEPGDKVPADLRLVRVHELQTNESALTGESLPVEKRIEPVPVASPLAERHNLAFSGTLVTAGHAAGVAVGTGASTEIGRIYEMVGEAADVVTPLTKKLATLSRVLTLAILAFAALTFGIGLWRGETFADMFLAAVALAVGAIPEGLPAAVTITLAIGVHRMARRHAIIRHLPAVETLGSTTVICTDKTGTLTENRMTVRTLVAGGRTYDVAAAVEGGPERIACGGRPVQLAEAPALHACLVAGVLCNDAQLPADADHGAAVGDPTELAVLEAACRAGLDPTAERARQPRLDVVPFESQHRYMATLHRAGAGGMVFMKGAVEAVVDRCTAVLDASDVEAPLDREAVVAAAEGLAARGLRVLAFAQGVVPQAAGGARDALAAGGLTFVGLQAMMDPPRAEAAAAVRACQDAGIAVKMITGDHALTAQVIAEQIGLGPAAEQAGGRPGVTTGAALAQTPPAAWPQVVADTAVFARVSPEQKLRIVEELQRQGHVVAMTGDGVNDAPALKQADIGVAMGRAGTEVAKESADMVLTDDNFASIKAAVEEGRAVFDNLTKFIVWTLPTNAGIGLVLVAAIALGVTLPILPVQSLWINMTTALALGLMLAFEPGEAQLMRRPPRRPDTPLLTLDLGMRVVLVSGLLLAGAFGLFVWEQRLGASEAAARTVAINVFVMVQIFYLLNCRSLEWSMLQIGPFSNPWVTRGIGAMAVLQLLLTYVPLMNQLFHTAPIGWAAWGRILAVGLIAYAVVGVEKWIRQTLRQRRGVAGAAPSAVAARRLRLEGTTAA